MIPIVKHFAVTCIPHNFGLAAYAYVRELRKRATEQTKTKLETQKQPLLLEHIVIKLC